MADALERLKERLVEVGDLGKVARLLGWDQQTMMPAAGSSTSCGRSRTRSTRTQTTRR
jgi:Zn-dependent M32 family carboxypeptidase